MMVARPRPRHRGLTLVELMVAMALTGLLASALLGIARLQTAAEQQAQQSQAVLETARGALEDVSQSLRSTALFHAPLRTANGGPQVTPLLAQNVNNPIADAPTPLPAVQVVNSNLGPDSLTVLSADTSVTATLMAAYAPGTPALVLSGVGPAEGRLRGGEFVVASRLGYNPGDPTLRDLTDATLFRLSADPPLVPNSAVTLAGGGSFNATAVAVVPMPGATLPAGSLVMRVRPLTYRVVTDFFGVGTHPCLVLQDGGPFRDFGTGLVPANEVLGENIVDFQVALAIDRNNNGQLDVEVGQAANDDEWVHNVAGEALPPNQRILAVRVSVVARSSQSFDTVGPGRPALEDHGGGAPDNYRYRTLTSLVALRSYTLNR